MNMPSLDNPIDNFSRLFSLEIENAAYMCVCVCACVRVF